MNWLLVAGAAALLLLLGDDAERRQGYAAIDEGRDILAVIDDEEDG